MPLSSSATLIACLAIGVHGDPREHEGRMFQHPFTHRMLGRQDLLYPCLKAKLSLPKLDVHLLDSALDVPIGHGVVSLSLIHI